eukprot:TRINITY_DN5569_c0_g1_i3.p1 TRINITY_DN5569_c0_g1~~TRINITY_DN5569_c0_g1_i3.p1  ORF type:complete len:201 (-),score=60.52 TRINITY_DN5569_c0_g1_i3:444-1046(-)
MIRRPPRSTLSSSSAASDVYKRQVSTQSTGDPKRAGMPQKSEKKPQLRGKKKLTDAQQKEVAEAFTLFDSEGTGFIDAQDLWVALAALGFEPQEDQFKRIMQDIDKNGTGKVSFDSFVQIMLNKLFEWPSDEEVRSGFKQAFVGEGADFITPEDLRRVADNIGNTAVTDEELQEMIGEADRNGDGVVDFEEFRAIITESF